MNVPSHDRNGWDEWARHVLSELERLNTCIQTMQEDMTSIRVEIATLKIKSGFAAGVVGLVGGLVPVVIMLVLQYLKK